MQSLLKTRWLNLTCSASLRGRPPARFPSWCWGWGPAQCRSAGAFAGAFAAFTFVAFLTNGARGGNERTILAGVAASQLFNAITAYTISTSASAQQARDVMFWLLGSFSGVRWPEFQLALVVVLIGLAICLYYSRALDAFTFVTTPRPRWGLPSSVRAGPLPPPH